MEQALSPRIIRRIVWLVFLAGVIGMIMGSIKDSNGFAITAGVITAIAAGGLILITSVAPPGSLANPRKAMIADGDRTSGATTETKATPPDLITETIGQDVENRVQALIDEGADETEVRKLVRRAMDLNAQRP